MTKASYGDLFDKIRRTRPMSYSAELLWQLLPPLTFANDDVVIAATFAPPYALGGDVFDYAVSHDTAHLAIFDAMGHGLQSGVLATIALAAYRSNRRGDAELLETVQAIDAAISEQYVDRSFATGVVTELDVRSGRFRYCIAGHPRPLLLRDGTDREGVERRRERRAARARRPTMGRGRRAARARRSRRAVHRRRRGGPQRRRVVPR